MEFLPRALSKPKTNFDDYVSREEQSELEREKDKSVQRIEHHEGFILKKHLPYGYWRVTSEDGSSLPSSLLGDFVRAADAKRAIEYYLETLHNETTSD